MLLVIMGAGASYDSVAEHPPGNSPKFEERPPLADELFDTREVFRDAVRRLPQCHPIVPLLRVREGRSLEDVLTGYLADAATYPEIYRQLLAVRYYIQLVLGQIEGKWLWDRATNVTNHKALYDQIRRWIGPHEAVATVTFNYDTIIEHALTALGCGFSALDRYIVDDRFPLFKLHGSVNWYRKIQVQPNPQPLTDNHWQCAEAIMNSADRLQVTDDFGISSQYPTAFVSGSFAIPAIAIPVTTKEAFECPPDHVTKLKGLLPKVTRVIIVGWKAGERHFLEILRTHLPAELPTLVVCDGLQNGQTVVHSLTEAGVHQKFDVVDEGFSGMIIRRTLDRFLGGAS